MAIDELPPVFWTWDSDHRGVSGEGTPTSLWDACTATRGNDGGQVFGASKARNRIAHLRRCNLVKPNGAGGWKPNCRHRRLDIHWNKFLGFGEDHQKRRIHVRNQLGSRL